MLAAKFNFVRSVDAAESEQGFQPSWVTKTVRHSSPFSLLILNLDS